MNISDMFIDLFVIFKSWLDVLPINFIECSIFNQTLTRNNLSHLDKRGQARTCPWTKLICLIACTIFPKFKNCTKNVTLF